MFVLALAALSTTAHAEAPAATPAPGPTLAPCTVLQPTYTIDGKNVAIGTMFATKVGERQVLVTAHSLFGPASGLPAQLSADDVVAKVTAATARDALKTTTECARTKKALKVADAAPMDKGVAAQDVAVFEVDLGSGPNRLQAVTPTPLGVLALADKAPKVDEPVWVLAVVDGGEGGKWPAKVVQADANSLYFQYDDASLALAGTTGAAVVNAAGAVVGLNVGGGTMPDDGSLIGSAVPLGALKQRITAAAQ
jgi:hypothetical protein